MINMMNGSIYQNTDIKLIDALGVVTLDKDLQYLYLFKIPFITKNELTIESSILTISIAKLM